MKPLVTLLTGPIRSGKTSWAAAASLHATDWGGVLQPDGPRGRVIRDLCTGREVSLEFFDDDFGEEVRVGRFRFRATAFAWADEVIATAAADPACRTVLVDEVGPLELDGRGVAEGVGAALSRASGMVMLVVRRSLLDAVRTRFALHDASVLDVSGLPHFGHSLTGPP